MKNQGMKLRYLFATICLSFLCQIVQAEDVNDGNLRYSIDESTKTASVIGTSSVRFYTISNIKVPASITYSGTKYAVTSIVSQAFKESTDIESLTISSVTSIEEYAFSGCKKLKTVKLGNSLASIATGVFEGCTSLNSITISETVTSIGDYAFVNCI